ncbi:MAG: hypothetical protein OEZ36_09115 [Spirochaetota bacterium]|nr:hypothetical protein [Spirochaetota bacterium]
MPKRFGFVVILACFLVEQGCPRQDKILSDYQEKNRLKPGQFHFTVWRVQRKTRMIFYP